MAVQRFIQSADWSAHVGMLLFPPAWTPIHRKADIGVSTSHVSLNICLLSICYINIMAKQMKFIDSLKVAFNDQDYAEFLNIRNWPRSFDKFILNRKEELQSQKDKLIAEMKE